MTTYLDPTREQFSVMMKLADDGPIHMLNLVQFRDKAIYPDGREATGEEAYLAYGKESAPIFERVGGRIAIVWSPKFTLIGPDHEKWDRAFVAEYPSAAAFGDMVKDPDYQKAVVHRQAAVENSRLIRLKPGETTTNFAS